MFCPRCGSARDEKDKFCRNCGYKFPEETPAVAPAPANPQIPAETLKKAKFYKYSLRIVYCAFTALTFVLCFLHVTAYPVFGGSVYGYAFLSGFTNVEPRYGRDLIFLDMFFNLFHRVDFVITPCALTVIISLLNLCFSIAAVIVMLSARRKTRAKAETMLLIEYAFLILIFTMMILGVILEYKEPVGAAPIALFLLALTAFVSSIVLYVKRKKFFRENPAVKDKINIKI